MNVFEFLLQLVRTVDIEVVIPSLPEAAQFAVWAWEVQCELAGRAALSRAHRPRHSLLQDLHKLCEIALSWFADEQVHVFGHHDITNEKRSAAVPHFSQDLHEEIARPDGA